MSSGKEIHLIDNLSAHKTKLWIASLPTIKRVATTRPYSSWLNQVENWFSSPAPT
jgi:hypothetical protein